MRNGVAFSHISRYDGSMDPNATYQLARQGNVQAARDMLAWLDRGGFLPAGNSDYDVRDSCQYVIWSHR